jgi:iron(III) transport system permease protein
MSSFSDGSDQSADGPAALSGAVPRTGRLDAVDAHSLLRGILILFVCAWLTVTVLCPLMQLLGKSLLDQKGNFAGLGNFVRYFQTPSLSVSLYNSLYVSVLTTLISGILGFLYAYALTRTCIPAKVFFQNVLMMLLFSPTLLNGIALIYLFGKKGLITLGFFGAFPGVDIGLYGPVGIIIAEIIYTLPQAVLILSVALLMTDARLYEASASLGASRVRTFFTITIPGIKYAFISTLFVCFIMSFTDFGAPKVVGGQFNILATDIYKQVVGQQNFVMGAVVSCILLIPTLIAFIADRFCQRKQFATISARSVPLIPTPQKMRDGLFLAYCLAITVLIGGYYLTALYASLVKVWPYNLSLGFQNYAFGRAGGGGYGALWNSIRMSLYSALAGTALAFFSAYLIEKGRGMNGLRQGAYLLSILPLAVPGLVIGLSYIFFFNPTSWSILGVHLPNPFSSLYGTMSILVLSNIVHFYAVSLITATAALKQLDKEFEAVSESLGVPFYKTFLRVTAPVCLPAILEIGAYFFVNSMATVSAVIFLYSPDIPLASVAVANMDDAGDTASACAMSILIVGINIIMRGIYNLLNRVVKRRTQRWMVR